MNSNNAENITLCSRYTKIFVTDRKKHVIHVNYPTKLPSKNRESRRDKEKKNIREIHMTI